jgi:hypothetical protein
MLGRAYQRLGKMPIDCRRIFLAKMYQSAERLRQSARTESLVDPALSQ